MEDHFGDRSPTPPVGEVGPPRFFNLRIDSAKNLRPADPNGFSDPYCNVDIVENEDISATSAPQQFCSQLQKTKVIRRTLDPIWREDFTFIVRNIHQAQLHV